MLCYQKQQHTISYHDKDCLLFFYGLMDISNSENISILSHRKIYNNFIDIYHFALVPEEPMLQDCVQRVVYYFEMHQVHNHLQYNNIKIQLTTECKYSFITIVCQKSKLFKTMFHLTIHLAIIYITPMPHHRMVRRYLSRKCTWGRNCLLLLLLCVCIF